MGNKRNTIQRRLILNALVELGTHPTAEAVYEHISKNHPTIGKATVYRNLRQMAELGEILDIGNFYGSAHYDPNCHKHYHFICKNCKSIFDVDADFSNLLDSVHSGNDIEITGFHISFTGVCLACK